MKMSEPAVSASLKGASYLILLQIGSRGITFILNQLVLRYLSPELLGLAAQLDLFAITVLYFARESVRVAVQRETKDTQKIVNFAYLPFVSGVPLALCLGILYIRTAPIAIPFLQQALWLYAFSCAVELLSEPAFVAAQQKLLYQIRARTEGFATVARCIATVATTVLLSRRGVASGVLPFAVGQLAYSTFITLMYSAQVRGVARKSGFSLAPKKLVPSSREQDTYVMSHLSSRLTHLTGSLFLQHGVKYILTQGDGILIAALTSLRDQGAYALASNYGGLIARMLFQPIEEITRNLFARTCAPSIPTEKASDAAKAQARILLEDILRLYSLLSLLACTLGPFLAPLLLRLVAGSKWADTEASTVLANYCYYIPFLAVNGVTEAFVAAVATSKDLRTQSTYMGVFFAGFAMAAYVFLHVLQLGAIGLVYSNCVNMAFRIVYNFTFIKSYFADSSHPFAITTILPTSMSLASSVAILALLRAPTPMIMAYGLLNELLYAVAISGIFVLALGVSERAYLLSTYRRFLRKSPSSQAVQPESSSKS